MDLSSLHLQCTFTFWVVKKCKLHVHKVHRPCSQGNFFLSYLLNHGKCFLHGVHLLCILYPRPPADGRLCWGSCRSFPASATIGDCSITWRTFRWMGVHVTHGWLQLLLVHRGGSWVPIQTTVDPLRSERLDASKSIHPILWRSLYLEKYNKNY